VKGSEAASEKKRLGGGHIIMANGAKAEQNRRTYLIRKTVEAWKNIHPKAAKQWAKNIKDLNDVDTGVRKEHANAYTKMRLPYHLFHSLRRVFEVYAKDLESFGTHDSDIALLQREYPDLVPSNPRKNRGRRSRK
jgi:hypothetical protein